MDSLEVAREDNASENSMSKKSNVRKRTKTGCLTCRKRRIKCDEAKPTCNNCQKSKRQCEGYNQRLTFKEPLGGPFHHGHLLGHPVYHHHHHPQGPDAFLAAQLEAQQQRVGIPQGPLPIIAPRPHLADYQGAVPLPYETYYPDAAGPFPLAPRLPIYSPELQVPGVPYMSPVDHSPPPLVHPASLSHPNFANPVAPIGHFHDGNRTVEPIPHLSNHRRPSVPISETTLVTPIDEEMPLDKIKSGGSGYWDSDDEASMGDSADEFYDDQEAAHLASNDLGVLVAQRLDNPASSHSTRTRDFTGSLHGNWLQTYTPSSTNSPLNDKETAAVFWYFVHVTGPSMSLYERHPLDPERFFQGRPVPKSRQHIWAYTFPAISFHHPALLQAMLALGSLQLAKRRCLPATAAMKHYHLSLRRIAKNYQSNYRRTQPATLAATLLLGFYEVWNSDHDKWCKHMWGARAILREIPLREMTWEVQALKRSRRQRLRQEMLSQHYNTNGRICDPAALVQEDDMDDVNPDFIEQITGRPVRFLEHRNSNTGRSSPGRYTEQDIENYEHLSDLFWWYCKMDVYQSILGGTQLFMEYDLWTQCAPRAPFGRRDAIYGTFDHVVLLLGRLANYASRDLIRKRRVMKADAAAEGVPSSQGNSPPNFAGLMPSSGLYSKPARFSPARDATPPSESGQERDPETAKLEALNEWSGLLEAFHAFREQLGPDFQPLDPEGHISEDTPFGRSISYSTYSIAGIWMNYYMGMIALYRAHPDMPPIATMAAGMTARDTTAWADEIGRIAAGLHDEDLSTVAEVITSTGSALIESSFCLFVAAVQFQDNARRHWVIKRMHDIARLTGWQSARQIADGCESAWNKAASLGRGSPYERANSSVLANSTSIWANPRRIDRRIRELENDGEDRIVLAKTERAHYALGLLGVEQDFERLELREGP